MNEPPQARARQDEKVPGTFKEFVRRYPELGAAHEKVGKAVEQYGPLDAQTLALIKIGIALGAGLESAVRSHVRRAKQAGASEEAIEQAILLGMNTVGFPRTVAGWSWAHVQFERDRQERGSDESSAEGRR